MNISFVHYDGALGPNPHTRLSIGDAILWDADDPVRCIPSQHVPQITRQPCFRLAAIVEQAASELQCTVEDIRTAAQFADVWIGTYTTTEPLEHWMEIHGAEFLARLLPDVETDQRGDVWQSLLETGEAVTRVVDQFGTSIEVVLFDRLSRILLEGIVADLVKLRAEIAALDLDSPPKPTTKKGKALKARLEDVVELHRKLEMLIPQTIANAANFLGVLVSAHEVEAATDTEPNAVSVEEVDGVVMVKMAAKGGK